MFWLAASTARCVANSAEEPMFRVEKDMAGSQRPGEPGLGSGRLPSGSGTVRRRGTWPVGGARPDRGARSGLWSAGQPVQGGGDGGAARSGEAAGGTGRLLEVGGQLEQCLVVLGEDGAPGLGGLLGQHAERDRVGGGAERLVQLLDREGAAELDLADLGGGAVDLFGRPGQEAHLAGDQQLPQGDQLEQQQLEQHSLAVEQPGQLLHIEVIGAENRSVKCFPRRTCEGLSRSGPVQPLTASERERAGTGREGPGWARGSPQASVKLIN